MENLEMPKGAEIPEGDFGRHFLAALADKEILKKLQEICGNQDLIEKEAGLLAYCVAHGNKERSFRTFTRQETINSELEAFERTVGRNASEYEQNLLNSSID